MAVSLLQQPGSWEALAHGCIIATAAWQLGGLCSWLYHCYSGLAAERPWIMAVSLQQRPDSWDSLAHGCTPVLFRRP